MRHETDEPPEWVAKARARGLGPALGLVLDLLEPLGPLGAQIVWIAQPALGLLVGRAALGGLARALEEPGGVERLRAHLED